MKQTLKSVDFHPFWRFRHFITLPKFDVSYLHPIYLVTKRQMGDRKYCVLVCSFTLWFVHAIQLEGDAHRTSKMKNKINVLPPLLFFLPLFLTLSAFLSLSLSFSLYCIYSFVYLLYYYLKPFLPINLQIFPSFS